MPFTVVKVLWRATLLCGSRPRADRQQLVAKKEGFIVTKEHYGVKQNGDNSRRR
jgi:hypothetical protein